jgi:hypothetical protein
MVSPCLMHQPAEEGGALAPDELRPLRVVERDRSRQEQFLLQVVEDQGQRVALPVLSRQHDSVVDERQRVEGGLPPAPTDHQADLRAVGPRQQRFAQQRPDATATGAVVALAHRVGGRCFVAGRDLNGPNQSGHVVLQG